jgi:hypothetical protein
MPMSDICTICGQAGHAAEDCTGKIAKFLQDGGGRESLFRTSKDGSGKSPATSAKKNGEKSNKKDSQEEPSSLTNAPAHPPSTPSWSLTGAEKVVQACLLAVGDLATARPATETLGDIYRVVQREYPEEYMTAFRSGFKRPPTCKDCGSEDIHGRKYCAPCYQRHYRAGDFEPSDLDQ